MSDHDHDWEGGIAALSHRSPEREAWHYQMMEALAPHFEKLGHPLSLNCIRIGVGYTASGRRKNGASIGQCLFLDVGKPTERYEITVRLDQEGGDNVAHTLIHELCHAALPAGVRHKAPFRQLMRGFGIEVDGGGQTCKGGKETPEFLAWLNALRYENSIGPYPHRGFEFDYEQEQQKKKQAKVPSVRLRCSSCGARASQSVQWWQRAPVLCGNPECSNRRGLLDVVERKQQMR